MLFKKKPYDRGAVLDAAERARAKGKKSKAISEYRKILAKDPEDAVVHGKIAPLLAETRQLPDAWKSFVLAAQGQVQDGFVDRAISIYQQAATHFPRAPEVWETIAKLHFERGRKADSVKALLAGERYFHRRKKDAAVATRLLRAALKIDPLNVAGTLALAQVLKRSGERAEAVALVEALSAQLGGEARKQLLGARFKLQPGFGALWRWLKA